MEEIEAAVEAVGTRQPADRALHLGLPLPGRGAEPAHDRHPARRGTRDCPIGYSGHETGLAPTWAAVTLGATFVERHITLDRAMWGSDQAASVEIGGLMRLLVATSATSSARWATASSASTTASCRRAQKLRRVPCALEVVGDTSRSRDRLAISSTEPAGVSWRSSPPRSSARRWCSSRSSGWLPLRPRASASCARVLVDDLVALRARAELPARPAHRALIDLASTGGTGLSRLHLVRTGRSGCRCCSSSSPTTCTSTCFTACSTASPLLWRMHEAHHATADVDWLSGARSHALEILINQTIEFAPDRAAGRGARGGAHQGRASTRCGACTSTRTSTCAAGCCSTSSTAPRCTAGTTPARSATA